MRNNYLNSLYNLKDKIIVVTGAAGQLGGQYVRALLGVGCRVAIPKVICQLCSRMI